MSLDTKKNWESLNVLATYANIKTKSWAGFLGPRSINACLNKIGRTFFTHTLYIEYSRLHTSTMAFKKKNSIRHNKNTNY